MKKSIALIWVLTLLLLAICLMVSLGVSFAFIFLVTFLGQLILIYTVILVLKEDYQSDKTFDDFYEDWPKDYI